MTHNPFIQLPAWNADFRNMNGLLEASKVNNIIRLDVGNAMFEPPAGLRVEEYQHEGGEPLAYYTMPRGRMELNQALLQRYSRRHPKLETSLDDMQQAAGGTHALYSICRTLLKPGDEVLLLSPFWLFTPGVVEMAGGVPIQIPFFDKLDGMSLSGIESLLDSYCTDRTKALYYNTPSNPMGVSLSPEQLDLLMHFAKKRGLKIIADNAYEDFDYSEHGFTDLIDHPDAREQVIGCYTMSKSYGMAGYRLGYIVTFIPGFIEAATHVATHSIFSANTPCQAAAAKMVKKLPDSSPYRETCRQAVDTVNSEFKALPVKHNGGFFAFFPTMLAGKPCSYRTFIPHAIEAGVSVAPGRAFGEAYENWARMCLVAVPAERISEAVRRLNGIMS